MKTLFLLRHAKSDWNADFKRDHDRPLNKRGQKGAKKIAKAMSDLNLIPEVVFSSDSKRTKETWQQVSKILKKKDISIPILYTEDLYHGELHDMQEILSNQDNGIQSILLLGHNPGWEDAASTLLQQNVVMTTANLIVLTHPSDDWEEAIYSNQWTLLHHLIPKDL